MVEVTRIHRVSKYSCFGCLLKTFWWGFGLNMIRNMKYVCLMHIPPSSNLVSDYNFHGYYWFHNQKFIWEVFKLKNPVSSSLSRKYHKHLVIWRSITTTLPIRETYCSSTTFHIFMIWYLNGQSCTQNMQFNYISIGFLGITSYFILFIHPNKIKSNAVPHWFVCHIMFWFFFGKIIFFLCLCIYVAIC